jgi:polysaccharide deacetylase family protein (PEP-CTERM system associated)
MITLYLAKTATMKNIVGAAAAVSSTAQYEHAAKHGVVSTESPRPVDLPTAVAAAERSAIEMRGARRDAPAACNGFMMDHGSAVGLPPGAGLAVPVFTVDVEDWFQVSAFDAHVDRARWSDCESRVVRNTERLLAVMSDNGARGTFFTLGWVAERFPALVRTIVDAGHEVASHGFWHQRIPTISPAAFREDVRRAKAVLEDTTGQRVRGYRAPSFSLTDEVPWAAQVLVEEGYTYDSSRFPIARRGYGAAGGRRDPHMLSTAAGPLAEYPPAVWLVAGQRVPVAGGGWFRQLPIAIIRRGLAAVLHERMPAVFYIHPWEIDPAQPRLPVGMVTRIRHYRGLHAAEARLRDLLSTWRFQSFAQLFSGAGQ